MEQNRTRYGADDQRTLVFELELGKALVEKDPSRATALQRRVYNLWRRTLGPDNDLTLEAGGDLAQTLRDNGGAAEAEPLLRAQLAALLKDQGEDDQDCLIAASLRDLARRAFFTGQGC